MIRALRAGRETMRPCEFSPPLSPASRALRRTESRNKRSLAEAMRRQDEGIRSTVAPGTLLCMGRTDEVPARARSQSLRRLGWKRFAPPHSGTETQIYGQKSDKYLICMKVCTRGISGSLITNLKSKFRKTKWRIQYVRLVYKRRYIYVTLQSFASKLG